MTNVVRIPIDVGGPEGTNSAYVLPDRGAVVDPGPPGESAWDRLRSGIEDAGVAVDDVVDVLVTHWHMDHSGQAPRLARAADATVTMHSADAPFLASYWETRERRVKCGERRMNDWGAPEQVIEMVKTADRPISIPDNTTVERVQDGDTVAGMDVIATPGHTEGHVAFRCGQDLLVGDAVLPMYTPNVGGSDVRLPDPLGPYFETLDRLETFDCVGRPGHGSDLSLHERIREIRDHHRERSSLVLEILSDSDGLTPWEVARELFGEMDGIHAMMGAGEAASHLVRLHEEGDVTKVTDDPDQYVRS